MGMQSRQKILTRLRHAVPALSRVAWVAAVATLTVLACRDRLPLVRNNHDVGHADEAAYALQARGLVWHGSTRVPYVSTFFRKYDPAIWRHDDHWPSPLGWVMAPAFLWQGVDAAVGRAVCVGLGAVALPWATAALAAVASRRRWTAALAAGLVLADTLIFQESLRMLADILMTALLVGFAAAVIAGRRNSRWYWLAGACAAWATLTKGSQILLLGLLPVGAVLVGGWRTLKDRRLWGGVAVAIALLLPRWITMWNEYGNPLHSTQNHVSAFYGLPGDWDESFYAVYWDQTPPTLRDRFCDREAWARSARRNAEVYLRSALLGEESRRHDWDSLGAFGGWVRRALLDDGAPRSSRRWQPVPSRPWRTALHAVALVWGAAMLLLWPLAGALRWAVRRGRGGRASVRARRTIAVPPSVPQVAASGPTVAVDGGRTCGEPCHKGCTLGAGAFLALLVFEQAAFVVFLWSADQIRFTLVLTPFLAVLGLCALAAPLERVGSAVRWLVRGWRARRLGVLGTGAAVLSVAGAVAVMVAAVRWHRPLLDWQLGRTDVRAPEGPFHPKYHAVAASLAEAGIGADAVVMTRNPWELLFYAPDGMRGVGLPYAPPETVFQVARYYGVTHFLHDKERPGLQRYLRMHPDAFRPVVRAPFTVYAINWGALQ
jgi:hypothetical protein